MQNTLKGKAHVFARGDINTDEILPARRMISHDEKVLAKFAMEDLDAGFASRVAQGDFVFAGDNFGCGSSREHAVWALRGSGVRAVLAKSFARIFFRNAVNNGFLALEFSQLDQINTGDQIEINLQHFQLRNLTSGQDFQMPKLPDFVLHIAAKGGLLNTINF